MTDNTFFDSRQLRQGLELSIANAKNAELTLKVIELERENKDLKSQHEDLVRRNATLRQRPDLPVDRLPVIREYEQEIASLKNKLIRLTIHAKVAVERMKDNDIPFAYVLERIINKIGEK